MAGLINMKMEKMEQGPAVPMCGHQEYPYGLRINLDHESLEKLGLSKLPEVGSELMIMAKVQVVGTNESESIEGGEYNNLSLQITDMKLEKTKKKSSEEALYGKE